MLVDLGRNDLGRVCEPGTVQGATTTAHVERYSHVMHLVSTVTGTLRRGPQRRSTPSPPASRRARCRGRRRCARWRSSRSWSRPAAASTAAIVGYLDFAGNADIAIAIRTALVRDGTAYVQAGGGIVADSDPRPRTPRR